jgi:hypothetical protein
MEEKETYIVKIYVDTAIVGENEVTDSVCPLNRELVAIKGFQKPWIF